MKTTLLTGNNIDIHVNGITICYDDLGKGDVPIIFIHGFPFNKSTWEPQMKFLKETHRVIAYDIRGLGKTSIGEEEITMRLLADDLVQFMDGLEINKAIVCGLSMGGYILLDALSRYPEKFEAIILSDTQCIADSDEVKKKRYQTISQINVEGTENFTEEYIKNIFYSGSLDTKKESVEKMKNIILSNSPETITRILNALAQRWQRCSSMEEITIPTLILSAKEDKVILPAQSEFMHKKIKKSLFYTIDKAGHVSNIEQPDEFNRHLINFISSLTE